MKKLFSITLLLLTLVALVSCNPYSKAYSKNVSLSMEKKLVSSGFIEMQFSTDRPAYYLVSACKAISGVDPFEVQSAFMDLAIDSAYVEYVQWRHALLLEREPYVADFPSHSLQYGETDYYFTHLLPDTDYWVFAFVVDSESNKPVGNLYLEEIRTKSVSLFEDVTFQYRVNGLWDYIYPVDAEGNIQGSVPWVVETADSLDLLEIINADSTIETPGWYFDRQFHKLQNDMNGRILYGIYAHCNDGVGDGTSDTKFEEGHIYYTAMAIFDGYRSSEAFDIYKFKWKGPDTQLFFTDEMSTGGAW